MPGADWRHGDQLLRVGIGQGLQQDAFENAENNGVGADAGGQGDQGDGGEHRRAAKSAQDLYELILEEFHRSAPIRITPVLTGTLIGRTHIEIRQAAGEVPCNFRATERK